MILLSGCAGPPDAPYAEHPVFNEVMANAEGDWVELFGTEALDLTGFTLLSHREDREDAWTFPDVRLEPDTFLVVTLGSEGELSAPFRLDYLGGDLLLLDGDRLVDEVRFPLTMPDESWAKMPDGGEDWATALSPTPGEPNSEAQ